MSTKETHRTKLIGDLQMPIIVRLAFLLLTGCSTAHLEFQEHQRKGLELCRQGRTAEAIAEYQQALLVRPNDTCVLTNMGICELKKGNLAAAKDTFSRVLQISPSNHEARTRLAIIAMKGGQADEAERSLKELVAEPGGGIALDHHTLARIYAKRHMYQLAIRENLRAIELNPTDPSTHFNLAGDYYSAKNFEKAAESYRFAAELEPQNYLSSLYWSARSFETLGKKADAQADYIRLLEASKLHPEWNIELRDSVKRLNALGGKSGASRAGRKILARSVRCSNERERCEAELKYVRTQRRAPADSLFDELKLTPLTPHGKAETTDRACNHLDSARKPTPLFCFEMSIVAE